MKKSTLLIGLALSILTITSCSKKKHNISDQELEELNKQTFVYHGEELNTKNEEDIEQLAKIFENENLITVVDVSNKEKKILLDSEEEFVQFQIDQNPEKTNSILAHSKFKKYLKTHPEASQVKIMKQREVIFKEFEVQHKVTKAQHSIVRFYEHANMQGMKFGNYIGANEKNFEQNVKAQHTASAGNSYMGPINWNDIASSVYLKTEQQEGWVVLYEDDDFEGKALALWIPSTEDQTLYELKDSRLTIRLFKPNITWNDQMSSFYFGYELVIVKSAPPGF